MTQFTLSVTGYGAHCYHERAMRLMPSSTSATSSHIHRKRCKAVHWTKPVFNNARGHCQLRMMHPASAISERDADKLLHADDSKTSILTLPTILTLSRVAAIPALIGAWFGTSNTASPFLTAGIFLAACITDFFDGYLARKMGTHSPFGAFLDPVADKLMVSTVLILLSSRPFVSGSFAGNTWLMPTIASAIIGREIAMSALREWAASLGSEAHKAVAVIPLGKWKTTTQMTALVLLLASSGGSQNNTVLEVCATTGPPLLMVAAFLTLFSLYEYLRGMWKYLL